MYTLKESAPLRYATFFYLYFMQGVPSGFALYAIANYLTGKGVSTSAVGTFITIVGIPWILQMAFGPLIDRYRYSVVGHYKHWVLLTQVAAFCASLTLLFVTKPEAQLTLISAVFFTHSLFASVQDASVDAMSIDVVPVAQRGRLNAFMRAGILFGIAFGTAGLSYVLHRAGFRMAALIQSGILLLFTCITFFIKLQRADPLFPRFTWNDLTRVVPGQEKDLKTVFKTLWQSMTERYNLRMAGIIILSFLSFGIFVQSFTFHLIQTLHWPDQKLSMLQGGWGTIITFSVLMAGGVLADRIGHNRLQRQVLFTLSLFLLLFNALSFAWHYNTVATTGWLIWSMADPIYSVAAFPILMTLCKPTIEGSQFTAYMSVINLCYIGGAYVSGWALRLFPAPVWGFACGLILMLCFYLLRNQKQQLATAAIAA